MRLIRWLFGCRHRRTTFPQTLVRDDGVSVATYVVCLDCGRQFVYSWPEMRRKT